MTDGLTPVFFKAIHKPEILRVLLDRGANPQLGAGADGPSITFKGSVFVQALVAGNISTVDLLLRRFQFRETPWATSRSVLSFLQAAAYGGVSMMEYLLRPKLRYPAIQDSLEVAEALEIVLSKADTATLVLLLERQLVGNLVSIDEKCVMALVSKRNGDLPKTAIAATLDMLMEHSIAMEIKDLHKSPLHDLYAFHDRIDLFQLLLDRGADPLRKSGKSGKGDTPLVHVSETGSKELVRMMFKSLDTRNDIPLEKLKTELERAEYMATWGLEKRAKTDVRPLLRRYYWRKKYQNMSTAINTVSSKTQQEEPKKESKKESKKGKLEAQKEKRRERRARRRRKAKIKDEVLFWDPKSLVQLLNVIRD